MHGHQQHRASFDLLGEQSPIAPESSQLDPPLATQFGRPPFCQVHRLEPCLPRSKESHRPGRPACTSWLCTQCGPELSPGRTPDKIRQPFARLNGLWYPWLRCWWLTSALAVLQHLRLSAGHSMHTNSSGFVRSSSSLAHLAHSGFFGLAHLMLSCLTASTHSRWFPRSFVHGSG